MTIKDGVEVGEICDLGDRLMNERVAKVFKKEKDALKGLSFHLFNWIALIHEFIFAAPASIL